MKALFTYLLGDSLVKAIFSLLGISFVGYIVFQVNSAYGWSMVIVGLGTGNPVRHRC